MKITTIGIDLAKSVFHVHGADQRGKPVLKKRLTRKRLLPFLANIPPCLVGMEACGGAHFWAREINKLGHDARLMSPQFVKPYVKTNKNDFNDAEGICEAVGRANMRFVPIKSQAQQDLQAIHRIRAQLIKSRTAQSNQIRGLLGEYGIVLPKGLSRLRAELPWVLEDAANGLSVTARRFIADLAARLSELDERIVQYDKEIQREFKQNDAARRIEQVEGVGPLVATAIVSAVGDATEFKNGRQLSAWLGLVPKQRSTGGKTVLLGISKRGDTYIRTLLIHGARSVVSYADRKQKDDQKSRWLRQLKARHGTNGAAVALANKNARIIWALLTQGTNYQPGYAHC